MVPGVQRRCFAERHDAPALDLGDREARVRAANVDRDDLFAHGSPLPVQMPVPMWNVAQPAAMQQGIAMRGVLRNEQPAGDEIERKSKRLNSRTSSAYRIPSSG